MHCTSVTKKCTCESWAALTSLKKVVRIMSLRFLELQQNVKLSTVHLSFPDEIAALSLRLIFLLDLIVCES